jgi:hypothetical protein
MRTDSPQGLALYFIKFRFSSTGQLEDRTHDAPIPWRNEPHGQSMSGLWENDDLGFLEAGSNIRDSPGQENSVKSVSS